MKTTFCDLSVERVTEGVREKKRETTKQAERLCKLSLLRVKSEFNKSKTSSQILKSRLFPQLNWTQWLYLIYPDVLKPVDLPSIECGWLESFLCLLFKYWKLLRSSLCLLLVNGHCTTAAHLPATDFLIFANYFNLQILTLPWESSLLDRRFFNSCHNSLATNNRILYYFPSFIHHTTRELNLMFIAE